jgi:hypothetical protein
VYICLQGESSFEVSASGCAEEPTYFPMTARTTLERLLPRDWKAVSLTPLQALEEEYQALHGRLPRADESGPPPDPLVALYRAIHGLEPKRSALCLSGGGIRSAAFGLGLLQGFARRRVLPSFDYLSTVSGGGYVGSWLSAWIKRHPEGANGVIDELAGVRATAERPEPAPVVHLREYSNYLNPRLGFLSADTWALGATILRNLLLNWLILLPLIAAITMIPRLWVAVLMLPVSATVAQSALWLAGLLGAVGASYAAFDLPALGNRRWPQSAFLSSCLTPVAVALYLLATYWAWSSAQYWTTHAETGGADLVGFLVVSAVLFVVPVFAGAGITRDLSRLVFLPPAAISGAAAGLVIWWLSHRVFPHPSEDASVLVYISLAPGVLLMVLGLATSLLVGLTSRISGDSDREWWARAGGWTLIVAAVVTLSSAAFVLGPLLSRPIREWLPSIGGLSGLATALIGLSTRTGFQKEVQSVKGKLSSRLVRGLMSLAPSLFVAVLLILLSLATTEILRPLVGGSPISILLAYVLVVGFLVALALLMSAVINVNEFSLHAMYRNRLIRAFLGASSPARKRRFTPFIGFTDEDNLAMKELSPARPFHVINIALNLVEVSRLAWQQRKAESFTVSRLHAGSPSLGYRPAERYGEAISLGTAAGISGAAASPNMGYHSSPAITFLMTLFNARLGWWLGNPGTHGNTTWYRPGPRFAFRPLISEALGRTTDTNPYVYLSDGGHFENLGLYSMVARRCHFIVASDAGCDEDYAFGDLGNAIRKIRIDLGIPIEFRGLNIGQDLPAGKYCALADVRYRCVDPDGVDGLLVYIKPTLTGGEPADVRNYRAKHPKFPHEPTMDQWFDESQFESYRALGLHIATTICPTEARSLGSFFEQIEVYLRGEAVGQPA